MKIIRLSAFILAALVGLAWQATIAHATNDRILVKPPLHHHVLYMNPDRATALSFESPIFDTAEPTDWKVGVTLERTADTLILEPEEGATAKQLRGQLFVITRQYTLVLDVRPQEKPGQAKSAIEVHHLPLDEVLRLAAEQLFQDRAKEMEKQHKGEIADLKAAHHASLEIERKQFATAMRHDEQRALLKGVTDTRANTKLLSDPDTCRDEPVSICALEWMDLGRYGVLRFVVNNMADVDFPVSAIQVSRPGEVRDRAGVVVIGDTEPVDSNDVDAVFRRGQQSIASVIVHEPATVGTSLRLLLQGSAQVVGSIKVVDLRPPQPREPAEGEGLITLSLQGIAGAVWLANPVDPGTLGATSSAGVEMRVRYGFNPRLSFEAALAGARSGSASWDGMTYNNQEGMLARDATVGRVLFGGLLHFGDKYRPLVRAGLGFQGVNHGSRFTPAGGSEQAGPNVDFELAGLWYAGLGFEARLGHHWTAGVGATFVGAAKSTSAYGLETSFEGGAHLSYGWTP